MAETQEEYEFADYKAWRKALNCAPPDSWLKERELGGGKKSKYVPLPIQQALADRFFRNFEVTESSIDVVVNEIIVTVKIHCLPNYPNSEPFTISGLGAKPIQMDSGNVASSFPIGKKVNAIEYNAPAARSAAISNALTTYANIFGRNVGRKETSNNLTFSSNKTEDAAGK